MARIWQSGFETSDTGVDTTEFDNDLFGAVNFTFDTTIVRTGTRSLKAVANNSTTEIGGTSFLGISGTEVYVGFGFYMAANPGPKTAMLYLFDTSQLTLLRIDVQAATGKLILVNRTSGADVVVGTMASALGTGAWHYIEMHLLKSATVGVAQLRVDGTLVIDGQNLNTSGRGTPDLISFANDSNASGTTADFYWDDAVVNDTLGSLNSSWPGNSKIVTLVPGSDTATINWTAQNAGTHFSEVDDLPAAVDTTTYIKTTNGAVGLEDRWNMTDTPAGIGSGDTINAIAVGVRGGSTATTLSPAAKIQLRDSSGNTADATAQTYNINGWATAYPALIKQQTWAGTPAAMTKAYLDGMIAAAIVTTQANQEMRITAVWVTVDYTPVTTITLSVFDSITATDTLSNIINIININNNDSITITENVIVYNWFPISVFDTITVVDKIIKYDDTIYVSESVSVQVASPVTILSVSVFDTITVTENISLTNIYGVIVSDNITISESIAFNIVSSISVFDAITVSENVVLAQIFTLLVFDSVAVTESIALVQISTPSVFDSITVAESIIFLETSSISTFETITIAENATMLDTDFISVFDSVSTTENISGTLVSAFSVFDSIAVTENIIFLNTDFINVWEHILVVEPRIDSRFDTNNIGANVQGGTGSSGETKQQAAQQFVAMGIAIRSIGIKLFQSGTPTDNFLVDITSSLGGASLGNVTIASASLVSSSVNEFTFSTPVATTIGNVYYFQMSRDGARDTTNTWKPYIDFNTKMFPQGSIWLRNNNVWSLDSTTTAYSFTITFNDNPTLELNSGINVNDSGTVSENINLTKVYGISIFDNITVTDILSQVQGTDNINVFDLVTVIENISNSGQLGGIVVFDSITVTENVADLEVSSELSLDTITVSENVSLLLTSRINVFEGVSVSESVGVTLVYGLSVFDSISITENISMLFIIPINISDSITILDKIIDLIVQTVWHGRTPISAPTYTNRTVISAPTWTNRTPVSDIWTNENRPIK